MRYSLRVIGRTLYFDTDYRLVAKFKSGLQQLKDAARPGSRATTTKSNMKKKIHDLPQKDASFTV